MHNWAVLAGPISQLMSLFLFEPRCEKAVFLYMQISFAVTAKLIGAFVFAIRIVQFLFYLNTKFQASSHLLSLCSPVCVRPGGKPRRPVFSERGSFIPILGYYRDQSGWGRQFGHGSLFTA